MREDSPDDDSLSREEDATYHEDPLVGKKDNTISDEDSRDREKDQQEENMNSNEVEIKEDSASGDYDASCSKGK